MRVFSVHPYDHITVGAVTDRFNVVMDLVDISDACLPQEAVADPAMS
jgi:hypothetical protein